MITENKGLRIKHIDYLKAIAIVLVVAGHVITTYRQLYSSNIFLDIAYSWIYSFHVSLFFVIAGYFCFSKKTFFGYLRDKAVRILVPFFFFSFLKIIYMSFVSPEMSHTGSMLGDVKETLLYGEVYWFCYALFSMYIIGYVFIDTSIVKTITMIIIIIVLNVISELLDLVHVPNYFQILETKYYLAFFLVGMVIRKLVMNETWYRFIYKCRKRIIICASFAITIIMTPFYGVTRYYLIPSMVLAFSTMIWLYGLSLTMEKIGSFKMLDMVGKYSFSIMLLEGFYRTALFRLFFYLIDISWLTIIVVAVLDIVLCILTCLIVERISILSILFGIKNNRNKVIDYTYNGER